MIRRHIVCLVAALGLTSCDEWESVGRLIPVEQRDRIPVEGLYADSPSDAPQREKVTISLAEDGLYNVLVQQNDRMDRTYLAAFDILGSSDSKERQEFEYLMEYRESPESNANYTLIRIFRLRDEEGNFEPWKIAHHILVCGKSVRPFASEESDDQHCYFQSYTNVRLAALEASKAIEDSPVLLFVNVYQKPEAEEGYHE